jgi:hypothetical protein
MIHSRSDCIYHPSIFDPDYSAISLLPWIPDNNPLFDLKNDDIGPKSRPKINIDSTISVTWLGPTPAILRRWVRWVEGGLGAYKKDPAGAGSLRGSGDTWPLSRREHSTFPANNILPVPYHLRGRAQELIVDRDCKLGGTGILTVWILTW